MNFADTRTKRRPITATVVGLLCLAGGLTSAGCAGLDNNPTYRSIMGQTVLGAPPTGPQSGPDSSFLADLPTPEPKKVLSASAPVLPLQPGNYWEMQNAVEKKLGEETIVVTGPAANAFGQSGMGVETQRKGKRFRYEIYKNDSTGLYLLAAQDETSTLMSYNPPVPLARYPAKEGDTYLWHGEMRLGKENFPANGLSRYSAQENAKTRAGKIYAFRLDTMISINRAGQDIRFPGVRWLAPNIGFVRRGYAERNQPAFSEVTKFNIR